jgi:hypothetical protein
VWLVLNKLIWVFAGLKEPCREPVESVLNLQTKEAIMRNRVRYVLKHVLDDLYELGKGIKRGQLQREMQKLTGKRESHFIHTSKTKVRYEQAVMKFADS